MTDQSTRVSPDPKENPLTSPHLKMLLEESRISPEIVAERGYKSITADQALELGFSENQADNGLLIPLLTPGGEIRYQLRHDVPRLALDKKRRLREVRYDTPSGTDICIDVHPSMHHLLRDERVPLWVTEGVRKADCLASLQRLALALTGVWNWGKKREVGGARYGRPELLADWDDLPLKGRKVLLCFDADYKEKRMVALALMRLAERLTQRLARVYIVSLPGPEKGVDDYIRAGGDLEELEEGARPYDPSLLLPYVFTEDRKIWEIVEASKRQVSIDTWARSSGKTDYSLMCALQELALERGRIVKDPYEVLEVIVGREELMERAAIGSSHTLLRSASRLEERGYIEVIRGDRSKGQANRYRFKLPKGALLIGGEGVKKNLTTPIPCAPSDYFTPHHPWSAPSNTSTPSASLMKPGKSREMALRKLCEWGGEASIRDLATALGTNHTTRTRRLLEVYEEAGVVKMDPKGKHGARVRLTDDWQKRLDEHRERGACRRP